MNEAETTATENAADIIPGHMTHEITIWCHSACPHSLWDQWPTHSKHIAAARARRTGWTYTKAVGWKCPYCSEASLVKSVPVVSPTRQDKGR